jgi:DNA-directed RNA polymerase subunit RPC12/RpoP
MYVAYRCMVCGTEFILPTETLKIAEKEGRYLSCPLGHKHIEVAGRFDDLKECMERQHVYKREHGRVKQVK